MSLFLSRLGTYSFTHPWRVLFAWLAIITAVAGLLASQPTSMSSGITLRNTPSQQVLDQIRAEVPQAQGTQGTLVFTSADGSRVDTPEHAAAIARALAAAQGTGYVVDREAKLDEQHTQVTGTVTTQVEDKVAAELTPQLRTTADALNAQIHKLTNPPTPPTSTSMASQIRAPATQAIQTPTQPVAAAQTQQPAPMSVGASPAPTSTSPTPTSAAPTPTSAAPTPNQAQALVEAQAQAKTAQAQAQAAQTQAQALRAQTQAQATLQAEAQARAQAQARSQATAQGQAWARNASMLAKLQDLATRADYLADAPAKEKIAGTSALFRDLSTLSTEAQQSGAGAALSLPSAPSGMTDPQTKVDQAVAEATARISTDLDRLTYGTDPAGAPLTVDGRIYRTIRVSPDGTTAVASLQLTEQVSDLPSSALDELLRAADDAVTPAGLTMSATSALLPVSPPLGGHEAIGLVVAAVVLLLTLGSLVAAGLPILTALTGVFIGVGGAFALSSHYQMTTATPALGLMIGLAVGIDYALFIVHKHRRLVATSGLPARETIGGAVGTSGGAVLFAGITVIIALLGLLTLGIGFVDTMALTAAATVALAVLIALTALPALLGLVGERIAGPRARRRLAPRRHGGQPVAGRWISVITARPLLTILAVVAVLGVLALPAPGLRLGMPSGSVADIGSAQRTAYDTITRGFGEGSNAPLVVAARRDSGEAFDQSALLSTQRDLADVEGAVNVTLMGVSPQADLAIYQVTPAEGPTADTTQATVTRLRSAELPGLKPLGVTGLTAMNIDLSDVLAAALPSYVGIVVLLSLVVLLVVFRSLLVPVAATLGFLLTMAATTGLVVTFFQNPDFTRFVGVDRAGPILSFLPIMTTGILYGLANDYQVFLGTSIREDHVRGSDARSAIRTGFFHSGQVVVAAAIIMVSVFGGFVLSSDSTIRQFGFALSAGILIDAFLIRMTLIPAVLHLAGEHAWHVPHWLDRILPTVDIEGDRLRRPASSTPTATTGRAQARAHQPMT